MDSFLFDKYEGTGNDFVLVADTVLPSVKEVQALCDRHVGIGADGLLHVVRGTGQAVVSYFNADGTQGICLNGARCVVHYLLNAPGGVQQEEVSFRLNDKVSVTGGKTKGQVWVRTSLTLSTKHIAKLDGYYKVDVAGSAHVVRLMEGDREMDIVREARRMRRREDANLNFLWMDKERLFLRSYERGVEAETLSCGSGALASVLVCRASMPKLSFYKVETRGGSLEVSSDLTVLRGKVCHVFSGLWQKRLHEGVSMGVSSVKA